MKAIPIQYEVEIKKKDGPWRTYGLPVSSEEEARKDVKIGRESFPRKSFRIVEVKRQVLEVHSPFVGEEVA